MYFTVTSGTQVPSFRRNDLHLRSVHNYLLQNRLLKLKGQLSQRLIGPAENKLKLIMYSVSQNYFKMCKSSAIQVSSLARFQAW